MVDSYEFKSNGKLGYIAIARNKNGKWLLKSLHPSNKSNMLFNDLFKEKETELKKLLGGEE